jgi:hypothetical protein
MDELGLESQKGNPVNMIKETLVKLGGWRAPVYFGGAADVGRWHWLARHALSGPVRTLDAGSGIGSLSFHAAKAGNGRCLDGSGNLKEGMAVRLARFS